MTLKKFKKLIDEFKSTPRFPTLFVGHGSPMNAIEKNQYSLAWDKLGQELPRPKVVLAISAHWLTEGTWVHVAKKPKTIHDFWGFPEELYRLKYPCPGAPDSAREVQSLITKTKVRSDEDWGLDHGTWVVLKHLFPQADVPVFQMSIDISKPGQFHYDLGQELAPLRNKGVLIIGSGNIVHNLGRMDYERDASAYDWAIEFDQLTKDLIGQGNDRSLVAYEKLGHAALLSVPTPDHYWPLLYTLGVRAKEETVTFPVDGIAFGSVSMRAVEWG